MTGLANGTVQLSWLSLGTLTDSTDGVQGSKSWSFSAPDSYFDYLAHGETVTLTYTVEVDDHHGGVTSQDVVVTINGSNDAPEIADIAQQGLAEQTDTAPLTTTIPVTFTDRRPVRCRPYRNDHPCGGDRRHHGPCARRGSADRAGDARRGDQGRRLFGRLGRPVILGGLDRIRLSGEGRES